MDSLPWGSYPLVGASLYNGVGIELLPLASLWTFPHVYDFELRVELHHIQATVVCFVGTFKG